MAQINKPSDYFNTKLYTGTGSTQSITGVGFQPDFTWIKDRTTGFDHPLFDAVRGATKMINSNQTYAESTQSTGLTSFDSNGFTTGAYVATNTNNDSFVSWNWLGANGTASNTDGSITSTVSANTTAGFSIVSYSGNSTAGATIGHGLGTTPAMFIIKNRSSAEHWAVYHQSISPSNMLYLNLTNAQDSANQFNSTAATSSVFSVSSNIMVNASSNNYIAYCFAEKKGFSKFGSYNGNGNVNGNFIYLGFKPAFFMYRRYDTTGNWGIKDNKRSGTAALQDFGQMNPNQTQNPSANVASVENKASAFAVDFLSNGIKIRGGDGDLNTNGGSYIYMAFAEQPLVGTNNIPATAR